MECLTLLRQQRCAQPSIAKPTFSIWCEVRQAIWTWPDRSSQMVWHIIQCSYTMISSDWSSHMVWHITVTLLLFVSPLEQSVSFPIRLSSGVSWRHESAPSPGISASLNTIFRFNVFLIRLIRFTLTAVPQYFDIWKYSGKWFFNFLCLDTSGVRQHIYNFSSPKCWNCAQEIKIYFPRCDSRHACMSHPVFAQTTTIGFWRRQ